MITVWEIYKIQTILHCNADAVSLQTRFLTYCDLCKDKSAMSTFKIIASSAKGSNISTNNQKQESV